MSTQMITTDHMKAGETDYLPGDLIDLDQLKESCGFTDRLIGQLTSTKRIAELNREQFQMAIARRVAGSPWPPRGLTQAYLEQEGLIDEGATPADSKAKPKSLIEHITLTDDKIAVGENFLQPKKAGNWTLYDAVDSQGRLLREKAFRDVEKGTAFLNALSTGQGSADTAQES